MLEDDIEDMKQSIDGLMDRLPYLSNEISIVRASLDIVLLLDQLHVKTVELNNEIEQFIQDLVLANTGSVTSTLLPITKFIQIIKTAKSEWKFEPFFDKSSVAM